jgi:hypothetical protein
LSFSEFLSIEFIKTSIVQYKISLFQLG